MSTQRIAVFGLTGLLMLAGLPTDDADARRKGLRQGADGPSVERLQRNLSRAGFSCAVDGAFGPATKASLMRWERWKHRRVDGIATRRDRRALRRSARFGTRLLHVGMRGREVRRVRLRRVCLSAFWSRRVATPFTRRPREPSQRITAAFVSGPNAPSIEVP